MPNARWAQQLLLKSHIATAVAIAVHIVAEHAAAAKRDV